MKFLWALQWKTTKNRKEDENVEIQMKLLKNIQEEVAGETPETEYLQSRIEEELQTREKQFKHLKDEIETEKHLIKLSLSIKFQIHSSSF